MSIVTENLNLNSRRFSVDIEKIKRALHWLMRNNNLYSNVQINSNITNEQLQSSIKEVIVTLQNEARVRIERQIHLKPLGNAKYIFHGCFHQGSEQFDESSRNRQCTAPSIAYSCIQALETWASSDVDRV